MKFPHIVNLNGVRYPAGAEVPVGSSSPEVKEEKRNEMTRSDVLTMRKTDLIDLALANGIADAEDRTAADLKAQLIKKLGL